MHRPILSSFLFFSHFYTVSCGPGSYAHYQLPNTQSGGTDIEHAVIWVIEPSPSELHGNAIFAATQMWQLAGPGGYMGTQRWRDSTTGKMVSKAIFSMWDASDSIQTGWRGPNCERFGGEGTGSHCMIDYPLLTNDTYIVKVSENGYNTSGRFWLGTITDMRSNEVKQIGELFHPNFNGAIGYGLLQIAAASFIEYFESDGCENQAQVGVGMLGPLFNNMTIRPIQASGDYASGCNYSETNGCIPGLECGEPKVYHLLGGQTRRTTPAGTPLW
jgi:hypothetical protein